MLPSIRVWLFPVLMLGYFISLSCGNPCHCSTGASGADLTFDIINGGGTCNSCFDEFISYEREGTPSLEMFVEPQYFISNLQSDYPPLTTGYTLLEEGSGNSSNSSGASIYRDNSYVGVCRFCSLYRDHDFVTNNRIVIYTDGNFVDFCGNNSNGFFCSECREGFYHDLGRSCVKCDQVGRDWVLYCTSQLIPITLLFIVLFKTKYSLVSGPLNAALFFAQMVSTTMNIDDSQIPLGNITSHAYSFTAVYEFLYGPTNLEFFAPFIYNLCLFHQQSYLYYFIAEYFVALYPLLLVAIVWLLYYLLKCICAHRRVRESFNRRINYMFTKNRMGPHSRNVLASVVFLSYVRFSWLSTLLFTPVPLYDYKSDKVASVFYLDPNKNYNHGDNGALIGLGFVCLFFVTLLPTLLLFVRYNSIPHYLSFFSDILEPFQRPFVTDPDTNVPVNIMQSSTAFMKCYSCFKRNDKQWISGVYLVLRVLLLVVYLCYPVFTLRFVLQQIICILGAVFFLLVRPYPNQWNNNLDSLFFLILALINTMSMYQFYLASVGQPLNLYIFIIQYIMIYTPLVWLVVCITYKIRMFFKTYRRVNLDIDNDHEGIDGGESIRLASSHNASGYSTMKF